MITSLGVLPRRSLEDHFQFLPQDLWMITFGNLWMIIRRSFPCAVDEGQVVYNRKLFDRWYMIVSCLIGGICSKL